MGCTVRPEADGVVTVFHLRIGRVERRTGRATPSGPADCPMCPVTARSVRRQTAASLRFQAPSGTGTGTLSMVTSPRHLLSGMDSHGIGKRARSRRRTRTGPAPHRRRIRVRAVVLCFGVDQSLFSLHASAEYSANQCICGGVRRVAVAAGGGRPRRSDAHRKSSRSAIHLADTGDITRQVDPIRRSVVCGWSG